MPAAPDDTPAPDVQAGAAAWLLGQWAGRGTERPRPCPVCGALDVWDAATGRYVIAHDPIAHGEAPPDPAVRDPSPVALRRLAEMLGERDDA